MHDEVIALAKAILARCEKTASETPSAYACSFCKGPLEAGGMLSDDEQHAICLQCVRIAGFQRPRHGQTFLPAPPKETR